MIGRTYLSFILCAVFLASCASHKTHRKYTSAAPEIQGDSKLSGVYFLPVGELKPRNKSNIIIKVEFDSSKRKVYFVVCKPPFQSLKDFSNHRIDLHILEEKCANSFLGKEKGYTFQEFEYLSDNLLGINKNTEEINIDRMTFSVFEGLILTIIAMKKFIDGIEMKINKTTELNIMMFTLLRNNKAFQKKVFNDLNLYLNLNNSLFKLLRESPIGSYDLQDGKFVISIKEMGEFRGLLEKTLK